MRLIAQFDSAARCAALERAACEQAAARTGVQGRVNPELCLGQLAGSCDTFRDYVLRGIATAACQYLPGTRYITAPCVAQEQCQADSVCRPPIGREGCSTCQPADAEGSLCTSPPMGAGDLECNAAAGARCVLFFDPVSGMLDTTQRCWRVLYLGFGERCAARSNRQCRTGLACGTDGRCARVAREGEACNPAADAAFCDNGAAGLECRAASGPAPYTCQVARRPVAMGAQCGLVGSVQQTCSALAYCDTSVTPPVCRERRGAGQPCTSTPDNCAAGLTCRGGLCQAAPDGDCADAGA